MSKYNKHQLIIICLIFFMLEYILYTDTKIFKLFQFTNFMEQNTIIFLSFIFIMTLGVSHGALDGKIIWEQGSNFSNRVKIYIFYLLIVSAGGLLWMIAPFAGLSLLLILSIFHFGSSDLKFLGTVSQIQKISWGFLMTFLPLGFHQERVNEIFYLLTKSSLNTTTFLVISSLLAIAFLIYIYIAVRKIFKNINKLSEILLLLELLFLVIIAYILDPIIWFAVYFCILHGIRAIIQLNFKWYPDLVWMIIFTSPIIIFILISGNSYTSNEMLILFPILACLTNAHMLLPRIIKVIKD